MTKYTNIYHYVILQSNLKFYNENWKPIIIAKYIQIIFSKILP